MKKLSKILSVVLVLAMIMGMAAVVSAEETATYTKITSKEELVSGTYVMIVDTGYAPLALDNGWLPCAQPTVSGNQVTDAKGAVWTLEVDGSSVKIKDSNGQYVGPKSGNANGIQNSEYSWAWACNDGTFTFSGTGTDTTTLASNGSTSGSNKFRAYKNKTAAGSDYHSKFTLYKLDGATGGDDDNTSGSEATPAVVESPVEGTAYKFGINQVNLSKTLYFTGEMSGYYLGTTENWDEAADVYIESVEGGLRLYFMNGTTKTYIDIVPRTDAAGKVNVVLSTAPSAVYSYNSDYHYYSAEVDGTAWYLGTYSTFNTISASKTSFIEDTSKIGVSQFVASMYAMPTGESGSEGGESGSEGGEGGSGENEGTGSGDTAAYTKVTDGELTSGKYILVDDNGYAPTVLEGNWLQSVQPTIGEDGNVTDSKGAVLTLTVDGSTVKIADANGVVIYNTGNGAKLYEDDTAWTWQYADGKFTFNDGGNDEGKIRYLGTSAKYDFKLRAYYQLEEPDSYGNFYYTYFTLYKLTGTDSGSTGSGTGSDSGSTDTGSGSGSSSDTGSTTTPEKPVETVKAPAVVASPVAGTAYKFGYYQANKDKTLWITGEMAGYYMATTDKWSEAADVYTETTDGGVYLYFMSGTTKTYINLVKNGNYTNFDLSATAATVYTYNTQYKYFSAKVGEDTVYLGTYKDYETMSASNVSYIEDASVIGKSQFLACMYEMTDVPAGSGSNPDTGDTTISLVVAALVVSALGMTAMVAKKKEF